ncbi:hypothetical protein OROHE_025454 [Orobanche hederae]
MMKGRGHGSVFVIFIVMILLITISVANAGKCQDCLQGCIDKLIMVACKYKCRNVCSLFHN